MSPLVLIRHAIKSVFYRLLPEPWQEDIDRRFYFQRLARGDLSDEVDFELLPRIVHPGDVVLDIGANLGGYTLRLSELVGPTGVVHAFEPIPRTMRLLRHNVRGLARHANVEFHQVAVSDVTGEADITTPVDHGGLQNYYVASLARAVPPRSRTDRVRTIRIDDLFASAARGVAFLKVDVEGAEWRVLSGARGLIVAQRPVILCEVADRDALHSSIEVFEMLRGLEYDGFRLIAGELHPRVIPDRLRMPNYLFIPHHSVSAFSDLIAAGE